MTAIKDFIKLHSLVVFFTLAFVISWGAILIMVGSEGIPATAEQLGVLIIAMLLGPSVTGVLMIGLVSGREGFCELRSRLLRWRVGNRWYAVALLTAPICTAVALIVLSLYSHHFIPAISTSDEKAALLIMWIIGGLFVGFFEELGWTGFAVPQMRLNHGIFKTGLIVGLLWGAWHFLVNLEIDSFSGVLPLALLLARLFSWLPAYRILMVWVYDRTESLLIVMLMHVSLVVTTGVIDPVLSGERLLIFLLAKAAVLWIIVAVLAATQRQSA